MAFVLGAHGAHRLDDGVIAGFRIGPDQVLAAHAHAGRADPQIVRLGGGPIAFQCPLVPQCVAALQLAGLAAGFGAAGLADGGAILDQRVLDELARRRAAIRAAFAALVDRIAVPAVQAEQAIAANCLEYEIAALVVADADQAVLQARTHDAAEAAFHPAGIAEAEFGHQSALRRVGAAGQGGGRRGAQVRRGQRRQRCRLAAGVLVATALAGEGERCARIQIAPGVPQFLRRCAADLGRTAALAQRQAAIQVRPGKGKIVGVHALEGIGEGARHRLLDLDLAGGFGEGRMAFHTLRRRLFRPGVAARCLIGGFLEAFNQRHAGERQGFLFAPARQGRLIGLGPGLEAAGQIRAAAAVGRWRRRRALRGLRQRVDLVHFRAQRAAAVFRRPGFGVGAFQIVGGDVVAGRGVGQRTRRLVRGVLGRGGRRLDAQLAAAIGVAVDAAGGRRGQRQGGEANQEGTGDPRGQHPCS